MRAVAQRVSQASVAVDGQVVGAIGEPGLLAWWGSPTMTRRKRRPRSWRPSCGTSASSTGKNLCSDVAAPLLVISQFTLYADTRKGRRPSWLAAAPGPVAEPLVGAVVFSVCYLGVGVETGIFGADMKVSLVNDGPVTIFLEL